MSEDDVVDADHDALVQGLARHAADGLTLQPSGRGTLEVTFDGRTHQVVLPQRAVHELLETAADDAWDAFGTRLPAVEAALRFLSIHLEELLFSRDVPDGARILYEQGGFRVEE